MQGEIGYDIKKSDFKNKERKKKGRLRMSAKVNILYRKENNSV